ncbi:c2h2 transcription factor [Gigaspora margarita]|uniref:C2h2 transcription factor n=2 Tax=Gigaspora TaxID=4873 RepID=A0A8H4AA12_GIGMA|nr:c2h2 transcription factor [Gigaspora margarita]
MSEELFQLLSPEQVMVVTSPHFQSTTSVTDNSIAALTNPESIDFTIYSQEPNYNDISNNGLFSNISQISQQLVEDYVVVVNSPYNSHIQSSPIIETSGYTQLDQSIQTQTSPHGNSINNNPSLTLHTNNVFVSPPSPFINITTPRVEDNIHLNSPVFSFLVPQQQPPQPNIHDLGSYNDIIQSPVYSDLGTRTVTTPITPSIWDFEDLYSSSLNTTPIIAPQTPATPYTPFTTPFDRFTSKDSLLYDTTGQEWYPLFNNTSNHLYCRMDSINPQIDVPEVEKKPDISSEITIVPGTPNSAASTSEKSPSLTVHELTSEMEPRSSNVDDINNNSGTKSPNSSDSAHTTPANTPRLVPIRPRESGEHSEPIRRSKRQRRSVSQDLDDEDVEDDGDDKKYNCPDCGRGFNRKFNMQTHRTTHDPNRIKPFACDHPNCGSRFTRKHDLKRHINGIHKSEKAHECSICRKPFARKDAWKRHNATCGKV